VRTSFPIALVVASLLAAPAALAQPKHDPAAADDLFTRGKELLAQGNWPEACAKFQASMELDPAVSTLLKIAKCHEREGKLALALHDYRAALALNRTRPNQTEERRAELEAFANAALAELEPRVPKLRVVVTNRPAGLKITRDGQELPLAALGEDLPVDPGTVEVVAEAPSFKQEKRSVVLREGGKQEVSITLMPIETPSTAPPPPVTMSPNSEPARDRGVDSGSSRRTIGFVVGGVGIVGLGVAGWLGLQTMSKVSDSQQYCDASYRCKQPGVDLINDARGTQTAGFIALGVGAVALGAGIYLVATSPSSRRIEVGVGPLGTFVRGRW